MYAEHYAQVIQYVWGYVGARSYLLQGDLQTVAQNIPRLRLDGPGIYSLWLKSSFHENKYVPTYVGFTSRPIQTRLGEHARFGKIGELSPDYPTVQQRQVELASLHWNSRRRWLAQWNPCFWKPSTSHRIPPTILCPAHCGRGPSTLIFPKMRRCPKAQGITRPSMTS